MVSAQRQFREPTFYYQFTPLFNAVLEHNLQYKRQVLDWEVSHKKETEKWQKEMNQMTERCGKGEIIHRMYSERMEKRKEELDVQVLSKKNLKLQMEYTISQATERLYGFFSDIKADLNGKYLPIEEYKTYLQRYKEVIQTGNNLSCYTANPISKKVLDEIEKFL